MSRQTSARSLHSLAGVIAVAALASVGHTAGSMSASAAPASATVVTAPAQLSPGDPTKPLKPRLVKSTVKIADLLGHRYELVNQASQLRADVMWASVKPYAGAFLWPNNTSKSQEFRLLAVGDGSFRIQAVHSGQCLMLDWRGGTYTNGTKVIQYPYCNNGYTPAQWYPRKVNYRIPCTPGVPSFCGYNVSKTLLVNKRTGRCLDTQNGRLGTPPARAVLQQWQCSTSYHDVKIGNQAWQFVDLDGPPPPRIG